MRQRQRHLLVHDELLIHPAHLRYLLHQRVFAVKLHHVKAHQARVRLRGIEEAQRVKLQRQLVLAHLGVRRGLLRLNLDIEYRPSHAHVLPAQHAERLPAQARVTVLHELLFAEAARDPELPRHIVKLPYQLNYQRYHLAVRPVTGLRAVAAALAAGLLKRRDGACRRHALRGRPRGRLGIAGSLAQFVHFSGLELHVIAAQRPVIYNFKRIIAEVAVHRHQRRRQIQKLVLMYAAVVAPEVSRHRAHHSVFDKRRVHQVYCRLRVAAQVDKTVAAGAALDGEQRVEDEGIKPVIIQRLVLVLRRVKHRVADVLDVVKHRAPVLPQLVVAVDHRRLAARIDRIII